MDSSSTQAPCPLPAQGGADLLRAGVRSLGQLLGQHEPLGWIEALECPLEGGLELRVLEQCPPNRGQAPLALVAGPAGGDDVALHPAVANEPSELRAHAGAVALLDALADLDADVDRARPSVVVGQVVDDAEQIAVVELAEQAEVDVARLIVVPSTTHCASPSPSPRSSGGRTSASPRGVRSG